MYSFYTILIIDTILKSIFIFRNQKLKNLKKHGLLGMILLIIWQFRCDMCTIIHHLVFLMFLFFVFFFHGLQFYYLGILFHSYLKQLPYSLLIWILQYGMKMWVCEKWESEYIKIIYILNLCSPKKYCNIIWNNIMW